MTLTVQKRKVPLAACLIDRVEFELLEAAADTPTVKREWSMLANTGAVMHRWWGNLVLDLQGAKFRQKLALLMDHRTDQRLGYSTKIQVTEKGLLAKGRLLDNELANQVLKESGDGFPFQASLRAVPRRVQEVDFGAEAEVNGTKVKGPVTIYREWDVDELTLTVLGADTNTTTEAFAANGEVEVAFERETTMTKKKNAPGQPADLGAAQDPNAAADDGGGTGEALAAETATAVDDPPAHAQNLTQLERARAAAILAAADPCQAELAQQLVASGVPLVEALSKLQADMRTRLGAAQASFRQGAQPLGGGNASGEDGTGAQELRAPAQLREFGDPEAWKKLFRREEALQVEFALPGEDLDVGEKRFVALQRFATKHLKGAERLAMLKPDARIAAVLKQDPQLLAAESHLQPLTERGVRGDFFLGLEERDDSWVKDIATIYQTDAPSETYPFLGQVPRLRKWDGPREEQELNRGKLTILNDDYEDTFQVKHQDWRRDKTGQISNHVQDMGQVAGELPLDLISNLLINAGGTTLAWDGLALIHDAHVFGKSTVDNDIEAADGLAGAADPTSAQMAKNIFVGIQRLLSFKDDQGRPMNQNAKSFVVMVPINMIAATEAALADQFTSAGVSNTLKTAIERGTFRIRMVWNGRLTATNQFFVWIDDRRAKPFVYQEEFVKPPYLLADGSEYTRRNNRVEIGAHMAGGAAAGKYELIVRGSTS